MVKLNLDPEKKSANKSYGVVEWFNDKMGYGFIKMEDGQDIFVHHSAIETQGSNTHKTLVEGDNVRFSVVDGKKGPQASMVEVLSEAEVQLERISEGLKSKKIDEKSAFHNLKSIVENSESEGERIRGLEYIKRLSIKDKIYFKFLENLAISDVSKAIRVLSMKMIIENFHKEGETVIRWVFEHEKSAERLLSFYNYLENLITPKSRILLKVIEKILGKKYIEKYKLNSSEAMALKLFELTFTDNFGYNRHYIKLGNDWVDFDTFNHSKIVFSIENGHVTAISSHEFPIDFSIMKFFENLRRLRLIYVDGQDLRGIEKFSNFEKLKLHFSPLNLKEIKFPICLKELSFNETRIEDLSILKDLKNLEKLSISKIEDVELYNRMYEIRSLENLTKLKKLKLRGCQLEEIKGLENLKNLEELDLSYNNIKEIMGLEKLVSLKKLFLGKNQIKDITILKDYTDLEYLDLSQNPIDDVSKIKSLRKLKYLDLSGTQIIEINWIENLAKLEYLNLRGNHLKNYDGIEKLANLKTFLIYANEVSQDKIDELRKKNPEIKIV
jgi:Leucine-rich repeat (LRR) protein/cold shock CspA family protein